MLGAGPAGSAALPPTPPPFPFGGPGAPPLPSLLEAHSRLHRALLLGRWCFGICLWSSLWEEPGGRAPSNRPEAFPEAHLVLLGAARSISPEPLSTFPGKGEHQCVPRTQPGRAAPPTAGSGVGVWGAATPTLGWNP